MYMRMKEKILNLLDSALEYDLYCGGRLKTQPYNSIWVKGVYYI